MITMEMAGMASRLTEQARRDAGAKIDRWRGAIEVVRQAEKQGDMTINLPTHLTVAANRAASAIYTADYVSAIGMAQQAIEAHQQVLEIASKSVAQEAHKRSTDLTQVAGKLETVKQAHKSTMDGYQYSVLPEAPNTISVAKMGCGVGVALFLLGSLSALCIDWGQILASIPSFIRFPILAIFFAFTFLGWVTLPIIAQIMYARRVGQVKRNISSEADAVAANHKMEIPSLRAEVDDAKKELDKATAAQRLLQTP